MPPAPFRVKATSIEDSSQTHEFDSIQAARRALMEWQQKNVGGHLLKKFALEGREAYGFRWKMLSTHIPAKSVSVKSTKHLEFKGRNMEGKDIYQFYNKPVVYMLECILDGNVYAHIGTTSDIQHRLQHVDKQYASCSLYSVYSIPDPICLEKKFKEFCERYHFQNQLYTGLKMEEFDDVLAELYCIMRSNSAHEKELEIMRINLEIERIKRDTEIERIKIEKELEMARTNLEISRINQELEMKRLDLEIAKLNTHNT